MSDIEERNDPCLICQNALSNIERCVVCDGYNRFKLEDYLWGIVCGKRVDTPPEKKEKMD